MRDLPEGYCAICGHQGPFSPFFPGASLRETRCPGCGSSRRNRDVARVLLAERLPSPVTGRHGPVALANCLEALSSLRIYELQAQGALHKILQSLPGYVCSEYFQDTAPGSHNDAGVLCQDATDLTLADASFDVVISQDILEHMEDPWRGLREIRRVLRPGGVHIFTVPLHEGRPTRQRARTGKRGAVEHFLPPVYHKDPLDPAGALVFWDYGEDLPALLEKKGIAARKALHARFYEPDELCCVDDEESWRCCREACERGGHVGFFIYNSVVFVAAGGTMT